MDKDAPTGWICPACGMGNAPTTRKCGHCPVHIQTHGGTNDIVINTKQD